jgi:hypothetical protein
MVLSIMSLDYSQVLSERVKQELVWEDYALESLFCSYYCIIGRQSKRPTHQIE